MKIYQPDAGIQGPPGNMTIGAPVAGGTPKEILYIDNGGNLFGDANATRDSVTNDTTIAKNRLGFVNQILAKDVTGGGNDGTGVNRYNLSGPGSESSAWAAADGAIAGSADLAILFANFTDITGLIASTIVGDSNGLFIGHDNSTTTTAIFNVSSSNGAVLGFDNINSANTYDRKFFVNSTNIGWKDTIMGYQFNLPQAIGAAGSILTDVLGNGTLSMQPAPATGVTSFNTLTGAVTISAGANITLTPVGNDIAIASTGGTPISLRTNGVNNGSQSILDLISGSNVTLTDNGIGGVTIDAASGSGVTFGAVATGFTPTWVQYVDLAGNQYGDALFTRNSTTNETNISAVSGTITNQTYTGQVGLIQGAYQYRHDTAGANAQAIVGAVDASAIDPTFSNVGAAAIYVTPTRQAGFLSGNLGTELIFSDVPSTKGALLAMNLTSTNIITSDTPGKLLAQFTQDLVAGRTGMSYVNDNTNTAGDIGVTDTVGVRMHYEYNNLLNKANTWTLFTDGGTFKSDIIAANKRYFDLNITTGIYQMGDVDGATNGMLVVADDTNRTVTIGDHNAVNKSTVVRVFDNSQVISGFTNTAGTQMMFHTGLPASAVFTSFGYKAGNVSISGLGNALFGSSAGFFLTSGTKNSIFSESSGDSLTTGHDNTGFGYGISFGTNNAIGRIAIGSGANANTDNQAVIGADSDNQKITELVLYRGPSSSSADQDGFVMRKTSASGTDKATGQWRINAGNSTGNKAGGAIIFGVARAGASGAGVNDALANDRLLINPTEIYNNSRIWATEATATAAGNMVCPTTTAGDSNFIRVTGNTTINGFDASWASPFYISTLFTGTPLLKHNTAPGAAYRALLLMGGVDYQVVAGDVLYFTYDGLALGGTGAFREVSRGTVSGYPVITTGLTNGRVPYWQGTLVDSGNMVFNGTDLFLGNRLIFTSNAASTTDGALWNDTNAKTLTQYTSGIKQWVDGSIFVQTADKTIANTVTETTILGTGDGTLTLPANFFVAGKTIKFDIQGYHSSTGNPTVTVKIKLGGTVIATGTGSSGNGSTDGFTIAGTITCRTTGAGGTVVAAGFYDEWHTNGLKIGLVQTGTTTIDTTTSQVLDITVTWGTAAAGNTITSQIGLIEKAH
jgi:hypothetical protein